MEKLKGKAIIIAKNSIYGVPNSDDLKDIRECFKTIKAPILKRGQVY